MFARVCFGVLILAAASTPAFAEGKCDSAAPVTPAIPSVAVVTGGTVADGQTKITSIYTDLHLYQKQLKDYRACLSAATAADQRKVNSTNAQKDADIKKAAQDEYARYQGLYNVSVDAEQSVADQINADVKAHCARDTSDFCKPSK